MSGQAVRDHQRRHRTAPATFTAAQEETESTGGARKRKNKKKKKPAAGAAARLEPASARPFSQEWFATFAVIAFFTVLAAAYTVVSFVVKKTTGAVA